MNYFSHSYSTHFLIITYKSLQIHMNLNIIFTYFSYSKNFSEKIVVLLRKVYAEKNNAKHKNVSKYTPKSLESLFNYHLHYYVEFLVKQKYLCDHLIFN